MTEEMTNKIRGLFAELRIGSVKEQFSARSRNSRRASPPSSPRDVYFNCSNCSQHMVIDESGAGSTVQCPGCGISLVVPGSKESQPRPSVGSCAVARPSASPPGPPPAVKARRGWEYKPAETIILTDNVSLGDRVLPVGTRGFIKSRPSDDPEMVNCNFGESIGEYDISIHETNLIGLDSPEGRKFRGLSFWIPGRRDCEGNWIIKMGRPLRIGLRDGSTIEGTPERSSGVVGVPSSTTLEIDGQKIAVSEIVELWWFSKFRAAS